MKKDKYTLVGVDGNAYAIMGSVKKLSDLTPDERYKMQKLARHQMLANLPVERDKFIPDEKLEEVKSAIHRYLQDFDYYQQLRRYFWNEHEMSCMERVFTIQTMTGTPILYIMISDDMPKPGTCAICDCDEEHACVHVDVGPCWWIDRKKILCSHCAINFDLSVNEGIW